MKYRKKPLIIEAFQLRKDGPTPTPDWFCAALQLEQVVMTNDCPVEFTIKTLEGEMIARLGDWIICGVNGELYPCKPDIFEKTYEQV